mgnify:CR=1 FL=1
MDYNNKEGYERIDHYHGKKTDSIAENYQGIIEKLGEDSQREGLLKTPERAAKAMQFLTQGYKQDPAEILKSALFKEDYNELVLVKDIEVYSMCEHHMLPFFGRAHVAYIPSEKVIGLSKIPRIVEMYARRLQVQERMTRQIADTIEEILSPQGVAVVVEGNHMCSMMRGVKKQEASMVTSAMLGCFKNSDKTRNEFLSHLQGKI